MPTRRRALTLAAVGLLGLAGLGGCAPGQRADSATPTRVVQLSAKTLAGKQISVPADGHVTVVNLWASWCGPCQREAPALAAARQQLPADTVDFVGLDERDTDAAGRRFAAKHGLTYPMIADPTGTLAARLPGVPPSSLPVTVVLDRTGQIRWQHVGPVTTAEVLAAASAA